MMKEFKRLAVFMILMFSLSGIAFAQDRYLMTGVARFEETKDAHALPFPVNPVGSSVLAPSNGAMTIRYGGHECSVKIQRRMNFYFDPVIARAFGSLDAFGTFLGDKFHMSYKDMNEIYLLGDANVPLCSGLRFAMVYKSADDLVLASGAWMYAFQRETHPPVNAEKSFDCSKARTNVERLVCANPDLVKLDEMVNRGFVAMQLVESKEISYQDPVRKDQINWIRNVRNKCVDNTCLTDAYRARVQYIKGRISSAYPSYPGNEPEQDGD
ncbi:lysozyme inhibitor LprI family protein [Burkholderia sp. F1]|uniref:lysozyme inhibitor LprI family protein n=1 Tax=Burkholderia sp. F1 TaxID=3366817 RepID=UPI003D72DB0F